MRHLIRWGTRLYIAVSAPALIAVGVVLCIVPYPVCVEVVESYLTAPAAVSSVAPPVATTETFLPRYIPVPRVPDDRLLVLDPKEKACVSAVRCVVLHQQHGLSQPHCEVGVPMSSEGSFYIIFTDNADANMAPIVVRIDKVQWAFVQERSNLQLAQAR